MKSGGQPGSSAAGSGAGSPLPEPTRPGAQALSRAGGLGEAARNSAWGGLGAVVAAILGFLLTAVIARTLGPAGAGTVFASIAVATILITLGTAGADTGVLWALPRNRTLEDGRRVREILFVALVPVIALSFLMAVALWSFAPRIATHIDGASGGTTLSLLRVLSLAVLFGPAIQVALQATRGLGDLRPFVAIQQVGLPLARFVGAAMLAVIGQVGPVAYGWTWSAPLMGAFAASMIVVRRRARRTVPAGRPPPRNATLTRSFWRYSLMRGLASACSMALLWCDVVLVAVLASPAAAGVYAVASRFATSGAIALQAMRLGIAPQVSSAFARDDMQEVRLLYSVTTAWAIVLCWPVFVTLGIFAPTLLGLFGVQYVAGSTALALLSVGMMVSVGVGNVGTLLLMSGRSQWVARNSAAALVANLALNVVLIPVLGMNGAALAWVASILVENLLGLYVVHRHLGVHGHRGPVRSLALLTLVLSLGLGYTAQQVLGATLPALALHLCVLSSALALMIYWRRSDLRLDVMFTRRRASAGR